MRPKLGRFLSPSCPLTGYHWRWVVFGYLWEARSLEDSALLHNRAPDRSLVDYDARPQVTAQSRSHLGAQKAVGRIYQGVQKHQWDGLSQLS